MSPTFDFSAVEFLLLVPAVAVVVLAFVPDYRLGSILIAFIVIGIFLFRIRERFDTVDVQALDRYRGERR